MNRILKLIGLITLKEYVKLKHQHERLTNAYNQMLEETGINKQACCRHHATPAQKMTQMYVCPECGDKRCNKAEICRLPCNDPKNLKGEKNDSPLFV